MTGFVVVPREPTEAMQAAGVDDLIAYLIGDIERSEDALASIYRAMISASPPLATSGEKP